MSGAKDICSSLWDWTREKFAQRFLTLPDQGGRGFKDQQVRQQLFVALRWAVYALLHLVFHPQGKA